MTPGERTFPGPFQSGEVRGSPPLLRVPPDSGLPQVAVPAGGLQRDLWGRSCAEDPVLRPGPRGGQGRGDPAGHPVPGAASPRAAGGLQPGGLPAQVSSPRVCSRQPELLACADAGPGPWGLKGSSVAQETGPPGRLRSVSEETL